jgi:tryptophan synthase alpha chain
MTTTLMTHLVANYPNPDLFKDALGAMFDNQVDFLEIQLPFSNPLADGEMIYQANQIALSYNHNLYQILEKIKKPSDCTTKLLLMSYITPLLQYGLENLAMALSQKGFSGAIIPDLIFGSPEQREFSELGKKYSFDIVPVISPLTSQLRLQKIMTYLNPGQVIYAMARSGRTGEQTELSGIQNYIDRITKSLAGFRIAVGFGIRNKQQVNYLNNQNIIAVIGSEVVRQIKTASDNQTSIRQTITDYLSTLQ